MLWAMNLHVFHRSSLQRVSFGGEEGKFFFTHSRDSYRYTMEQHFISTAGTLKSGINRTSDH